MNALLKRVSLSVILMCGFFILPAAPCLSAVIVYDNVTTTGTPVFLKVLTKGIIFADGGRLVEFFLDENSLGKNLTGGDGYGYRKYAPERPGLFKIEARSKGESGSGLLLVAQKSDKVVFIEIESGFKDAFISEIAAGATRRAVETMKKKYRIVYLSRYTGVRAARDLLVEGDLPAAPVLRWKGSEMLSALKERGIKLHAVIGSAGLIEECDEYIDRRYTFEKTGNGQTVKDWAEIIELLKKKPSKESAEDKKKSSN